MMAVFLPDFFLYKKSRMRDLKIFRELPDVLDLVVSCMEAGLGFEMALLKVYEELRSTCPVIAGEASRFFHETQGGINREKALDGIRKRNRERSLADVINIILQSFKFGTDIAEPLRVHSDVLRREREQKAEEKASMVSVKLSIPLVLLILPSLLIVLVAPAFINLYEKGIFEIFSI
jgi:tight adherence protein C